MVETPHIFVRLKMTIAANSKYRNKFVITLYAKVSCLLLFLVSWHPKLSKKVYLSQENIWDFIVIQENVATDLTFFSKFRLWRPIFSRKFWNFKSKFQSCNLQLITFPKRYFASKSNNKWLRYRLRKVKKTCKNSKKWFSSGFFIRFLKEI